MIGLHQSITKCSRQHQLVKMVFFQMRHMVDPSTEVGAHGEAELQSDDPFD
jgi:hypothetical protein